MVMCTFVKSVCVEMCTGQLLFPWNRTGPSVHSSIQLLWNKTLWNPLFILHACKMLYKLVATPTDRSCSTEVEWKSYTVTHKHADRDIYCTIHIYFSLSHTYILDSNRNMIRCCAFKKCVRFKISFTKDLLIDRQTQMHRDTPHTSLAKHMSLFSQNNFKV